MLVPRLLTAADVPAATTLLERSGLAGGAANVTRYVRWQPDGAWGCDDDTGALAGIVTVLRFGTVGFVGCMAVEPALQGRGIGRALLEHAQQHARQLACTTFLLEATPSGALLYSRLGYVVEYESAIVGRTATGEAAAGSIADQLPAILELDRLATASPRDTMIRALATEFTGAYLPDGYGLVVGERLGPVIARTAEAGRALIERLVPACTVATVPIGNLAALESHGFTVVRMLARMRLGPPVPIHTDWIYALASPGAG